MKLLILYLSNHGLTEKLSYRVAHWVEEVSRLANRSSGEASVCCEVYDINTLGFTIPWLNYHAVILAAPVYYGKVSKQIYQFVTEHAADLNGRPTAFICTNLSARKPNRNSPNTNPYLQRFLRKSPWHPTQAMVFAGALDYSRYRLWERWIIRAIMLFTGGETNPKTAVEYTPWEAVHQWSKAFYYGELLGERLHERVR